MFRVRLVSLPRLNLFELKYSENINIVKQHFFEIAICYYIINELHITYQCLFI